MQTCMAKEERSADSHHTRHMCLFSVVKTKNIFFIFSERELKFMFAIAVRLSSVCLKPLVRTTQAIEIFGNISTPCGTLAIHDLCIKILRRSSQGNPSVGGS